MNYYLELQRYTKIDTSEQQELCDLLLEISCCCNSMSDEFLPEVEDEIQRQLEHYKAHGKIVTLERRIPAKPAEIIKELVIEWY